MLRWFGAGLAVVVVAVGLWAFQPWRLFTSSEVDEAPPRSETALDGSPSDTGSAGAEETEVPRPDRVLARGRFEDAEHATSGRVVVIELGDGRRFVRLEDLATSDGPDLHVWLTDRPSGGDWGSYDDGRHVRLGDLKATHGNQNYEIPTEAGLAGLASVVIWCDRFNVAFGTAPVRLS